MTEEQAAFIKAEIKKAAAIQKLPREGQAAALCDEAGCNDKVRAVHIKGYTSGHWNSHPSERFKRWWMNQGQDRCEKETGSAWKGVPTVQAYNCERVREVWREHLNEERDELRRFEEGDTTYEIPF